MRNRHPDPAQIAAYDGALLPLEEEARLSRHLRHCTDCSQVQTDLATLRQELTDLPIPALPDSVALRIDTALDAEAARAMRRRRRAKVHVSRETVPRRRRAHIALGVVGAAAALGVSGALLQIMDLRDTSETADATLSHGSKSLETQVRELLTQSGGTQSPGVLADGSAGTANPSHQTEATGSTRQETAGSPAALPDCVLDAIDRHEEPLAAGEEDYRGQDAYIVVLPHSADPDRVDAYVIAAGCATSSPKGSGKVLVHASYDRP